MSELIRIAEWNGQVSANVVFIHGLGGHAYDTWRKGSNDESLWPVWLVRDIAGLTAYTVSYAAPVSNWLGTAMPLQDRAVSILEVLLSEKALRERPVALIGHSLGGLLIKQLLLDLDRQKSRRSEAAALLDQITRVVFIATPHAGSRHASLLDKLRFLAWPSWPTKVLVANDPALRAINVDYRGLAEERREKLRHLVFYETQGTAVGVIVDEASSDPGLPGDPPIPIDADHIKISKPADVSGLLYTRIRNFLADLCTAKNTESDKLSLFAEKLPPIRRQYSWNVVPKVLRLAAVGAVLMIFLKGVSALFGPQEVVSPADVHQLEERNKHISEQNDQIIKMAQRLLSLNEAQAAPGRQQAIVHAVAATAAGAAEGDTRMQRALNFLSSGRAVEAETLLRTVAEEKERLVTTTSKEAAEAYRNLGAISGLANPARSRQAYGRAVKLDPEDRESLYWCGYLELLAGNLNEAQQNLESLLQTSATARDERGTYRGQLRLVAVFITRGNLTEAHKRSVIAHEIATRNASNDPSDTEWQSALALSLKTMGLISKAQGKSAEALADHENALSIHQRLFRNDDTNTSWQTALASDQDDVGAVLADQGRLSKALAIYEVSFASRQRLVNSANDNAAWKSDLALSFNNMGAAYEAQGKSSEALNAFQQSLTIRQGLADSDKDNAGWQTYVASSYLDLCRVMEKQKKLDQAAAACRQSLQLHRRLAEGDDTNFTQKANVGRSRAALAYVLEAQGQYDNALSAWHENVELFRRLVQNDQNNASWRKMLANAYLNLSTNQKESASMIDARDAASASLTIFRELANADPENADWQVGLSRSCIAIGDVLAYQRDLKAAQENYQQALELRFKIAAIDQDNLDNQFLLGSAYQRLGNVFGMGGKVAESFEAHRKSLEIWERISDVDKLNLLWLEAVGFAHYKVSSQLWTLYRLPEAKDEALKSLELRNKLVMLAPDEAIFQNELAVAHRLVGSLDVAQGAEDDAYKHFEEGLSVLDNLLKDGKGNTETRYEKVMTLIKLGDTLNRRGKSSEALDRYSSAASLLERADPTNIDWTFAAVDVQWRLAQKGINPIEKWQWIVSTLRKLRDEEKLTASTIRDLQTAEKNLSIVQTSKPLGSGKPKKSIVVR